MKVLFISLGCDKNLVDSEVMLGLIRDKGYVLTNEEEEAEIIVINTCAFINDAKEESVNTILEMAELKKNGNCKILMVTGCLAERYKEEILGEIKEVDAIIGTTSYNEIINAIEDCKDGKRKSYFKNINIDSPINTNRLLTTGGYYSYLKIAEGCDNHCTYCIIPKLRGKYRSRKLEEIVNEAKFLASQGVKELILVAQDTTLYGTDIYGVKALPKLLEELMLIEEIKWIRLLYCYPETISDELIEKIKNSPKIVNYLDIPIQHINNEILKKMGRKTTKETIINKINKIRDNIPDIALRTTIITGFPSETEHQHEEVINFINEIQFDRLGVFSYSAEEDTPASLLPEQICEEIKERRQEEIMLVQQKISETLSRKMIGHVMDILVEGYLPEDSIYVGRSYKDAPNVDNYVFFESNRELISGDIVKVKITESNEYDLIGEM